ncbi:hypothetical protein CSA57_14075 [candidate division KSB3 bacterium]|nr:MAG: hypothetical protein CSA57_14075 [candidate division KSB3 bacterium]
MGSNIVKMCEAFQELEEIDVTLFVPTRMQSRRMKQVKNLWEEYDIAQSFSIQWIKSPDFLQWRLPPRFLMFLYHTQGIFFSLKALLTTLFIRNGIYYTRSLEVLLVLCVFKLIHRKRIYFEAHELHGNPLQRGVCRRIYRCLIRRDFFTRYLPYPGLSAYLNAADVLILPNTEACILGR